MIISFKENISENRIDEISSRIKKMGGNVTKFSNGVEKFLILPNDLQKKIEGKLKIFEEIENVKYIDEEFQIVSKKSGILPESLEMYGDSLDNNNFLIIAGPCSVEDKNMLDEIASFVKEYGVNYLRGGVFKPRTNPYSFQGLGEKGLEIMREVADKYSLKVVTEVTEPGKVKLVEKFSDIIQVGSRNSSNFPLLRAVGKTSKPILLKRGMSANLNEFLLSAEYIVSSGNSRVILCERGIRTFETATRNTLDLSAVPLLKEKTNLPVIVDPSHGTGKSSLVTPMALASAAVGADGIIVEVHIEPQKALSDGFQTLNIMEFKEMVNKLKKIILCIGKNNI